jgi:hypothetical protein
MRVSMNAVIRKHKRDWMRGLFKRIGPEAFWTRRLNWLADNGKARALRQLIAVLQRKGFEIAVDFDGILHVRRVSETEDDFSASPSR